MPSQRPPRDDGSSHDDNAPLSTGQRQESETRHRDMRRPSLMPGAPQASKDVDIGLDMWATFRTPRVTNTHITDGFPFDVSGVPTMQLPALPKELFPTPTRQPRQRPQADTADPTLVRPPVEDSTSVGVDDELAVDELPTWVLPAISVPAETPVRKRLPLGRGLEGYLGLVGGLLKSSGSYALASMVSPLISLVLSPFVTHHLSRAEYGALAVVSTTISLTAGLSQLGLGSAFFRAYNYDFTSERERRSIIATAGMLLALSTLPIAALVALTAPLISMLLFGTTNDSQLIVIG
ncbi:MAG TPA: hypothetical protein VFN11_09450, partial [Ktedonobacterales bacterium]|nr:hypothetical protein [Ktedonobacterales bacterium]